MNITEFEVSDKVCISVLVNPKNEAKNKPLGDFISSKLDEADIYREHLIVHPCYNAMNRAIIRQSHFVSEREAAGWYYTIFLVAVSQKDKAIKVFNRYGVVVGVDEL
jgi:hypothetical protein